MPKIIFNIATVQRRRGMFLEVLKCLAYQSVKCDKINVAMSYDILDKDVVKFLKANFKSYHIKLGQSLPSEYKMFALDTFPYDSIPLLFDDDIIYPQDYVEKTIKAIERYERKAVVGWHGIRFDKFPVTQYKQQKKMFQYFKRVEQDTPVHVIGTGCLGFYMGTLLEKRLLFERINKELNCLDGSFGRWCRDNQIPTIVLAHENDWIKIYPDSQDEKALWRRSHAERYKTKLSFLDQ